MVKLGCIVCTVIVMTDIVYSADIFSEKQGDFESNPVENMKLAKVPQKWTSLEEPLKDMMQVRCGEEGMLFLVHFNPKTSHLQHAFAYKLRDKAKLTFFGPQNTLTQPCGVKGLQEDNGVLTLSTPFDKCDTLAVTQNNSRNDTVHVYKNMVELHVPYPPAEVAANETLALQVLNGVRLRLDVQCTYPLSTHQMDLQLEDYDKNILVPERGRSSVIVNIDSWLYLRPVTQLQAVVNKNISSFAESCFLSSSPFAESQSTPSSLLIENGCPKPSFVRIGDSRKTDKYRIGVKLSDKLMPLKLDTNIVYMHCSIIACSRAHHDYISNIPKCPSATYCSEHQRQDAPPSLPLEATSSPRLKITSKPITVVGHNMEPPNRFTERCEVYCSAKRGMKEQARISSPLPAPQVPVSSGVSMQATVFISFAAFLSGLICMAIIWLIHVKTDPHRHLQVEETSVEANGQLIPLNCHSETNAVVTSNNNKPCERRKAPVNRFTILLRHLK